MQTLPRWNKKFSPVVIGGILSALCILLSYTLGSYTLSDHVIFSTQQLLFVLVGVGALQAIVQLICFFHLGQEARPYWNAGLFIGSLVLIVIVVWGTLWIVSHLNGNLMPWMPWMEDMHRGL